MSTMDWANREGDYWAANAPRYRRMLAPYGDAVIAAADLRPGERVLDVGCGNGDLALAAARIVGPTGAVQGVDLSPAMVAVATQQAADAGLHQATFTVCDATTFRPDPAGYDILISRFGVMFFDDPVATFTNLHSLLAPTGRLAFACWQDLFSNDWMIVPAAGALEVLPMPEPDPPGSPGPFAFADRDHVVDILTSAGFTDPTLTPGRTPTWIGDDAQQAAGFLRTSGLGRALFDGVDPDVEREALAHVVAALEPHESPTGIELDGSYWIVTAIA